MKKNAKYILIISASLLLAGLTYLTTNFIIGGPQSRLAGFNKSMQVRYEQLELGTPRKEVIAQLGSPLSSRDTFCLPPGHKGFKDSLARANGSNAITYDLWINGINWYYCIGFDISGLLAIKAEGHS